MNFSNWFQSQHSKQSIQDKSIQAVLSLKEEGATVPFIARYRKEFTGGLDEVQIRDIIDGHEKWQDLVKRKLHVLSEIEKQGKLTKELKEKIDSTWNFATLEDIYLPYKVKRKTKAAKAKEAGLEPLADWIWNCGHGLEQPQPGQTLQLWAFTFRNDKHDIKDATSAIDGAQDILVERLSEMADLRETVRKALFERGALRTEKGPKAQAHSKFEKYFDFSEKVKTLIEPQNSHRYMALRRGWLQEELKLSLGGYGDDPLESELLELFESKALKAELKDSFDGAPILLKAARLALKAHVWPSIENEIHTALKKVSDQASIKVFSENVKRLLLAPPMGPKAVLGVDPGIRTGCKLALVDDDGKYLVDGVLHLQNEEQRQNSKKQLLQAVATGKIKVIAVGNGTAGRETQIFLKETLKEAGIDIPVVMVNEAGASVYSASDVAREEFPKLDVTVRGAISIARRLQDPLAELVKIDPKSIGVGQYQHDVSQTALKKSLDEVVDDCVNAVGVNLNTASFILLSHVSGIGEGLAKAIVDYRGRNGLFKNREELKLVPRFSAKTFEQAAGFIRIPESDNPLDNTGVHPERYSLIEETAKRLGKQLQDVLGPQGVQLLKADPIFKKELGEFTFNDVIKELEKPGRDVRGEFNLFNYRDDVHELSDLKPNMVLPGVVTNVTNFGAFVDIGVHQDGLVHISQLSHKYVDDPQKVVKPGDQVQVKVLEVNLEKKQIALTMRLEEKAAKAEQRPQHKGPQRHGDQRPNGAQADKRRDQRPHQSKAPQQGKSHQKPEKPGFKNNPFAGLASLMKK